MNILFVCTGNTCRSKMAETICKNLLEKKKLDNVKINSCGINIESGSKTAALAKNVLLGLGIKMTISKAKGIDSVKLSKFNYVITMTNLQKEIIKKTYPGVVYTLGELTNNEEVLDPFGLGYTEYKQTAEQLKTMIELLLKNIITIG